MGKEYLIDTNILIFYYDDHIPSKSVEIVDDIFFKSFNISIITKIEFLGWQNYDERQYQNAVLFAEGARIFPLVESIANKAIELKRKKRIKLPDAVIAATCLINDFILVTRNQDDFKSIEGLELYNPFEV
jgi:predicted nucleic acid-binding protein